MNSGYEFSRAWFDFCFENPEKISPNHTAIYFFAIEHCNRLGWKEKFGFPTQMTMDAIGIKKHQTYIRYFNDLVEWGFIKLIQKSSNQYSANIISLKCAMPKKGKALDKAFITHAAKQTEPTGQSIGQSNSSIDKQQTTNNKPIKQENGVLSQIGIDGAVKDLLSDELWIHNIRHLTKNKNLEGAARSAFLYLETKPERFKVADLNDLKKTTISWLSNSSNSPVNSFVENGRPKSKTH